MRIVIVDDHKLFLQGLVSIVSEKLENPEILTYSNAKTAIDMLDIYEGQFDLAMVDLHLPGVDGLGFLRALASRKYNIPTLVVSATTSETLVASALRLGARGFAEKAGDIESLHWSIDEVLAGRIALPKKYQALADSDGPASDHALEIHELVKGRQMEVLQLVVQGYANKAIAQILNISDATVKTHVSGLFRNLEVTNRTECARRAKELGIVK